MIFTLLQLLLDWLFFPALAILKQSGCRRDSEQHASSSGTTGFCPLFDPLSHDMEFICCAVILWNTFSHPVAIGALPDPHPSECCTSRDVPIDVFSDFLKLIRTGTCASTFRDAGEAILLEKVMKLWEEVARWRLQVRKGENWNRREWAHCFHLSCEWCNWLRRVSGCCRGARRCSVVEGVGRGGRKRRRSKEKEWEREQRMSEQESENV